MQRIAAALGFGLAASGGVGKGLVGGVEDEGTAHGERDLQVVLEQRGRLPVDALPIVATTDLGAAIGSGLSAIGGDLPLDGSIGAMTAWVGEPYVDGSSGVSYCAEDELAELFHGLDADPEQRQLVAAATACDLCEKLAEEGVDRFHFYTLNRPQLTAAICRRLGLKPMQEAA